MSHYCKRCHKIVDNIVISMFDNKKICHGCQELEIEHIQFEEAREAIMISISKGDYEFNGIGLPVDLLKKQ